MVKRPASAAGSPPPTTATKAKKPKPSTTSAKPKAPKKTTTTKKQLAGSGAAGRDRAGTPLGSPPPVGTPGGGGGIASSPPTSARGMSPPRGRSTSVFDGGDTPGAPVKGGTKSKLKGKPAPGSELNYDPEDDQPTATTTTTGGGDDRDEPDGAEDDEDLKFDDDEFGSNAQEIAKQKEDLRVLLEHFNDEQMSRYEHYRRSGLNKSSVRKLVNQVVGQTVSPSILTVVRGFAKVFVGEIVEKARSNSPHPGPLTPQDLRDAYRLYCDEHQGAGGGGQGGSRKKMFVK
ncbi:TATA-binding protein-associated factor TAF11 [Sporobolomyces koalae]|uniref:TATA-binding protein-associated factor TAF11 n=1 Tax=Sporobolomyces koalae TaxID=500713 RepID=UPI00317D0E62